MVSSQNPNELFGVRACLYAAQHKHQDCGGDWYTFDGVNVANPLAPRASICANHIQTVAKELIGAVVADLGYAAPPGPRIVELPHHGRGFVSEKDTVVKPRPKAKRRPAPEEELSL
jgi:hypothetical protein